MHSGHTFSVAFLFFKSTIYSTDF